MTFVLPDFHVLLPSEHGCFDVLVPIEDCIGCAHVAALKVQSYVDDFKQLADSQRYAIASAMYAYDNSLQFQNPCEDMPAGRRFLTMVDFALLRIKQLSTLDGEKPNSWHGTGHMCTDRNATSILS